MRVHPGVTFPSCSRKAAHIPSSWRERVTTQHSYQSRLAKTGLQLGSFQRETVCKLWNLRAQHLRRQRAANLLLLLQPTRGSIGVPQFPAACHILLERDQTINKHRNGAFEMEQHFFLSVFIFCYISATKKKKQKPENQFLCRTNLVWIVFCHLFDLAVQLLFLWRRSWPVGADRKWKGGARNLLS